MGERKDTFKKMDLEDLIADCEVNFEDCQDSIKYKKTARTKRHHQKLINFFGSVTEYLKELESKKQNQCNCS
jgi:hypothetical protein